MTPLNGPRGGLRFLLLILPFALMIAGCSSIPSAGPVGTISASAEPDSAGFVNNPSGPQPGATATEVLSGFVLAGTGVTDNYSVSRAFLTDELASTWQPEERVIIYRADPKYSQTATEGQFLIQIEVAGSVDARGIRNNAPAATTESIPVEMVQVDGQWRINSIPSGIMISTGDVTNLLSSHNLYFYSSGFSYWVPDVRWFVNRQGIATNIVQAMLEGPAPYLQGAVTSAFPENATLAVESVPIDSGTATVDLNADILLETSNLQRQQMEQQLRISLTGLNTVNTVDMRAGQPIDLGDPDPDLAPTVQDPNVGSTQVVVSDNELAFLDGLQLSAIEGVPSVSDLEPQDPAMSINQENLAFLNGEATQLFATGVGQTVRPLLTGTDLTAPSFGPGNWLWVAGSVSGESAVRAVPPGGGSGTAVRIAAPWLSDRVIQELRISRDGARALIVAEQSGSSQVLISGITTSGEGTPLSLSEPIVLNPSNPVNTAKWVSEDSVVVAQASADQSVSVEILDFASAPVKVSPLAGIVHISAGSGAGDIYAQTGDQIQLLLGRAWAEQGVTARDPAFPG